MKKSSLLKFVRPLMVVAALLTVSTVSTEAQAGFGWFFPKHSGGGGGGGGGGGYGGGGYGGGGGGGGGVPEIDAGSAAGAMTLLFGGVLLLRDKFNLRHKREE